MALKVVLSDAVRDQVEASAAASGNSLAEEIRWRAEWLLALEPVDQPTLDLLAAVARMAAELERETGSAWHAHAGSFAALRQAILSKLARIKPEGDLEFGPRPHRADASDDPQEIGIWAEFSDWTTRDLAPAGRLQYRLAKEQSFAEIMKLQQREQEGGE